MIHWSLTTQQADQILNTLAQRPFAEVTALIQELMRQAQAQPPAPAFIEPPKANGQDKGRDKGPPVISTGVGA